MPVKNLLIPYRRSPAGRRYYFFLMNIHIFPSCFQQFLNLFHRQPLAIIVRTIGKPFFHFLPAQIRLLLIVPYHLRINNKMFIVFVGRIGILHRNHDFVKFLPRPDAHLRHFTARKHSLRQIRNLKGRYLADKGLPSRGFFQCLDNQFHSLGQADPEPCHPVIRNWQFFSPVFDNIMEKRNDRAPASCHIPVSHNREINVFRSRIRIGCHKKLVRYQLRAAIKVHRVYRFIRGQRHHLLHIGIQCRIYHILGSMDIRFNRFVRIVLAGRHLF